MFEGIYMDYNTMELITVFVAVVGGMKALEWVLKILFGQHDKVQQIDTNKEDFADYKAKNDKEIAEIKKSLNNAHKYAQDSLDEMKSEIMESIKEQRDLIQKDKTDYIDGIQEVKASITEMSGVYQQTVAIIEIKIDNLEKKQDLHNSVISRTYELEKQVSLLDNREKVSEHRLTDVENKLK